jgi:phosphate/sulfate permease
MAEHHEGEEKQRLESFLQNFQSAELKEMEVLLKEAKLKKTQLGLSKTERKQLKSIYKENLVRRSAMNKIIAAWIITVPCSAGLAALIYFFISDISII